MNIETLSGWQQHLLLVEEILSIPKELQGVVVECGCYDGSSTANLSLACALTNRHLIVCDSFEGLPSVIEDEKYAIHGKSTDYYKWEKGEFHSHGGLEGVTRSVAKYGDIQVCTFLKGYFNDTLERIVSPVVMVFEDADLASSVRDCLKHIWPLLLDGCKFYSHEAWDINVVSVFYDKKWWEEELNTNIPGFFGSGQGTIKDIRFFPDIGFTKKFNLDNIKKNGKQLVHMGSKGFE